MNKRTITTRENQDVFDIAIQEFGTIESVFSGGLQTAISLGGDNLLIFAKSFPENFYSIFPAGQKIILVNTEKIGDAVVQNKLNLTSFVVDNSGEAEIQEPSGDGIGFWFIEDDFIVQ